MKGEKKRIFYGVVRRAKFSAFWVHNIVKSNKKNEKIEIKRIHRERIRSRESCVFASFFVITGMESVLAGYLVLENISKAFSFGLGTIHANMSLKFPFVKGIFYFGKSFLSRLVGSVFKRPIHSGVVVSCKRNDKVDTGGPCEFLTGII